MNEMNITKKMLEKLRESKTKQAKEAAQVFVKEEKEVDNFITRSKTLMQEAVNNNKKKILTEEENNEDHRKSFKIKKNTPQFGDVRTSQEESIKKTINSSVKFDEDEALKYYPDAEDITLDGVLPQMGLSFQFRFAEPSGDGCFVFCDAFQLTETNTRLIGKIRDAYKNWHDTIVQDGDLMEKLKKASKEND